MPESTVSLDFETRSVVDLKRHGVYVYAEHPDTDVLCMAWAVDDEDPAIWILGDPCPERLRDLATRDDVQFRAWNAQFERVIWHAVMVPHYRFPAVPLERWYCTAAEAAAMALPRSLDDAAAVLRVAEQKDTAAWQLVSRLSRPRAVDKKTQRPIWWTPLDDPEKYERLYAYCQQDVRTERAISRATRRLSAGEREVYLLDQRINGRGIVVDTALAQAMQRVTDIGMREANATIAAATAGAVGAVTKISDLTLWLSLQGVQVDSVRKSIVRELLEGEHPDPVRRALEARAEAGRSSTAKIESVLRGVCRDGCIRGLLLYHGAGTGRWSGKQAQPQNFPRPVVPAPEQYIPDLLGATHSAAAEDVYARLDLFHPPLAVVSSLLRALLRARPRHRLVVGDFAQIEARVLAWLAGQTDLVQLFARGGKVYETMAAHIYRVPVGDIGKNDPRRQMGKNAVLGCGYQLGPDTFAAQVYEQTGVRMSPEEAKSAVGGYRELYPAIPALWRGLEEAAYGAVQTPGAVQTVRGCRFVVRGSYLWLVLPSGRPLAYAVPRIRSVMTPWGEPKSAVTAESTDSTTKRWQRRPYYGGLWTENIVQALARDLLAAAMLRVEAAGYPVVLTVHDEIVTDTPEGHGSVREFEALMAESPAWAKGCPVAVDGWEGERYRK